MNKLLTLLLLFCASPAWATTYYASSVSGSNSNSCATAQSSTASNAKQTLIGSTGAFSCLASGDTLRLHVGSNFTDVVLTDVAGHDIPNGTSYATATTIESFGSGTVTWTPSATSAIRFRANDSYIILRAVPGAAFVINAASVGTSGWCMTFESASNTVGGTHHIKLDGLEIKNSPGSCLGASNNEARDLWFTHLYVHDNVTGGTSQNHAAYLAGDDHIIEHSRFINTGFGAALHLFDSNGNGDGLVDRVTVRYNYIANSGTTGIVLDGRDAKIYRNIIVDNGTAGINCGYSGSSGALIANNTIHSNTGNGLSLGHSGTCQNLTLRNNSISSNATCGISTQSVSGGNFNNNNCNGNTTNTLGSGTATVTNTTTVAPNYINAAAFDFGLIKNGVTTSALINAGTAAAPTGVTCHEGNCDIGAHETFTFGSAALVDDASDNKILVNFSNDNAPPLLPSTGCSGFTLLKNGGADAISSCARTGDGQYTLTTTGGHIAGDTITVSYSQTAGNVTNTAIGDTYHQKMSTFAATAVTNPLTGGSSSVLTQVKCQFFSFGGGVNTADRALAAINTDIFLMPGACARLRCQVSNTAADFGLGGFLPYFSKDGGAYAVIPDGPAPATSIAFPSEGNLPPEYGTVTTPTTELLGGSGTFTPGGSQPRSSEVPSVTLNTTTMQDTELDFPFCLGAGNAAAATFDFRYRASGTVLDAYTVTPRVTISTTASQANTGAR